MIGTIAPAPPPGVQLVTERRADTSVAFYTHAHWARHDAWLVHGTTDRTADMSVFGSAPAGMVLPRWVALRDALGCTVMVHARQVHRADVLVHERLPDGILIARDADGHATSRPAALLAVSVADCVPIFLAAPDVRAVALLHAGWRGVAHAIVERGVGTLHSAFGADPARLLVHCGPAICGDCFEVGPEVARELGVEGSPARVDLRAVIAHRLIARGVAPEHISASSHCTRCGDTPFYSHRGGCGERQLGVLAIRA